MAARPCFLLRDLITKIISPTLKQRQRNSNKHYIPTFDTTMGNIQIKVIGLNSTVIYLKVNLHTEKTHIHSNAELMRLLSKLLRFKYKSNGIIPDVCHQSDREKTFGNTVKVIQIRKRDIIQNLMNSRAIITSKQKIKQGIGINYFILLLG